MKNTPSPFKNAALCTHCGYCLPVCPTYRVENNELHSPRGRVSIILALQSSELTVEEAATALDHCLVCRVCHVACPAGVRPAKLALTLRTMAPLRTTFFIRLFHHICRSHHLAAGLSALLSFYRRSGLQKFIRHFGVLHFFPALSRVESLVPQYRREERLPLLPLETEGDEVNDRVPAKQGGTPSRVLPIGSVEFVSPVERIGLLCGCMARIFFPGVAPSSAQLLARLGVSVVPLDGFGCCGAPFRESGDRKVFLHQARRVLDAFLAVAPLDAVVCDSSVCAVTTRAYARALAEDRVYAEVAKAFSAKTETLSQFLARKSDRGFLKSPHCEQGVVFTSEAPGFGKLAYQDHCQSRHGLGVMAEPRSLLAALPVRYHELSQTSDLSYVGCCGAGGSYLLRHPKRSRDILQHKLDILQKSGVGTVVGENPGCLLNISSGLEKAHSTVRVCHLAEFLWEVYSQKVTMKM